MQIYRFENPDFVNDYVSYLSVVKGLSKNTVMVYYQDIRQFLRFITLWKAKTEEITAEKLKTVKIQDFTVEQLKTVTLRDIHNYYSFIANECHNQDKIRTRKASSLRSFFGYLTKQVGVLDYDPTTNLELSSPKRALPKYLNLSESKELLKTSANSAHKANLRDYCILTLFLNCGLRLGELIGLNLSSLDMEEMQMRVLGKGSKERIVYLNSACMSALEEYLPEREAIDTKETALFLSNQEKRISRRRVQQIVEESLREAGFSGRGLSTHKLRHTAATLMYQHGHVDVLTLKKILGHESIATTEIYTHLTDESVRNAMDVSPLANIKKDNL
ncbi:MAG TPA: recombinase XerC [Ruminococcus sp.]|nr:recombinase XerC [Ruminococcus sp.]